MNQCSSSRSRTDPSARVGACAPIIYLNFVHPFRLEPGNHLNHLHNQQNYITKCLPSNLNLYRHGTMFLVKLCYHCLSSNIFVHTVFAYNSRANHVYLTA